MRSRLALHIAFVFATGISCLSYAGACTTSVHAVATARYAGHFNRALGLTKGKSRSGELLGNQSSADVFIARPLIGRLFRTASMYRS